VIKIEIVHELEDWGRVAAQLGPGTNWHEPDNYGLMGRFDGTDGDLDNAGFWPSEATGVGVNHGYGFSREYGEMAIIISADSYERGERYRGPDLAAVNVANLLGWAAEAAHLRAKVRRLENEMEALRASNEEMRAERAGF
jgi:hypothetical protein